MAELPSHWLGLIIAEGDASAPLAGGSILLKLLSVILLVAANGFFVAAEFALVGVRTSRIETLVASGNRAAKRLMGLLKNLNAYLSACQLGITLASLALGWIGEPAVARLLEAPLAKLPDSIRHELPSRLRSRSLPHCTSYSANRPRSWRVWPSPKRWRSRSLCRCNFFTNCSAGPFALLTGPASGQFNF